MKLTFLFSKKGCCSVKLAVLVLEKKKKVATVENWQFVFWRKKNACSTDSSSVLFGKTVAATLNGQFLFRKKVAATGQFLLVERKLLQC